MATIRRRVCAEFAGGVKLKLSARPFALTCSFLARPGRGGLGTTNEPSVWVEIGRPFLGDLGDELAATGGSEGRAEVNRADSRRELARSTCENPFACSTKVTLTLAGRVAW